MKGGPGGAALREVVTPEGVALRFEPADVAERAAAFGIDATIIVLLVLLGIVPLAAIGALVAGPLGWAAALVVFFVVRCFYFTGFEARWHGGTPGKRALGLRVIDARGGPLTGEAVFARNLMRELEFFLPLVLLLAPREALPEMPPWARPLAIAWVAVPALLPLINRDGLRAGDLLAGTLVVRIPRTRLLGELSAPAAPASRAAPAAPPAYRFSAGQLDLYGIYELQVLEALLRQAADPDDARLVAVAERIQRKVGWTQGHGPGGPQAFLQAFYQAQRARLEQRLALGERRERKRDVSRRP